MYFDEVGVIIARDEPPCQWRLMLNPFGLVPEEFVYFARKRRLRRGSAGGKQQKKQKPRALAWRFFSLLVVRALTARWRYAHNRRRSDHPGRRRGK